MHSPRTDRVRVLVTGAGGFIGQNLCSQLSTRGSYDVLPVTRETPADELRRLVAGADFICHLAGANRPADDTEFTTANVDFTRALCSAASESKRRTPIIFASSVHAESGTPYGKSKLAAETVLRDYEKETGAPAYIFRLPHVFGKWCRPNYNSAVATFCYNVVHGLPLRVDNPDYQFHLLYVDDLVDSFRRVMETAEIESGNCEAGPVYPITLAELADKIRGFRENRGALKVDRVGSGLTRALYATYLSYVPPDEFAYSVPSHADARGVFVEMLKTPDAGQLSFFTAGPGTTRGGHYHHTKNEKFLVVKGSARFRFKHIITGQTHEVLTSSDTAQIVEAVPGWTHDITNVGQDEMVVMLWANEVLDQTRPDTYAAAL